MGFSLALASQQSQAAPLLQWVERLVPREPFLARDRGRPHRRSVPAAVPDRGGQMRAIAFLAYSADIRKILE
jgi:hypothetical protein